jgi:hypothetical protein
MSIVVLPHLGASIPPYLEDCVHQIRLWNKDTYIFIILDPVHKNVEFWNRLKSTYDVIYQYTDRLEPTLAHRLFNASYKCDTAFRQGYWRYVVERFFFVEELMLALDITHCIVMEYDILIYTDLAKLTTKFKASYPTCRIACDNKIRASPGFIYVPNAEEMGKITAFIQRNVSTGLNDVDLFGKYANEHPESIHYLPLIAEARNKSITPRKSATGHMDANPYYLSQDSEHFGVLFDAAAVGQYVGGIDPRNIGGRKSGSYENETALYSIKEMPLEWMRTNGLWQPMLDTRPLVMIHLHCKSLASFRSDRATTPADDYEVRDILPGLVKNQ